MKDKRTLVDRKIVSIKVRNKTFDIGFISNYMIREHSKIIEDSNRAAKLYADFKKAENENNLKRMEELSGALLDFDKNDYFNRRTALIKEILTENGIEFDAKWWDRKTGPDDIMIFLNEAVNKDVNKSKKKEESL